MLGKGSLFVEAPHLLKPEMQFDSFFFPHFTWEGMENYIKDIDFKKYLLFVNSF